ncbi:LytR C-terminal domain-containing protein [Longimicrobium terrae]|uniref:Pyruvate/2-oxoglutarate dehydrogenase complex dihydrolipoamide acyltransferase (E2) component n=1 Tax=Longimicrobium terrae TaxID=1639882 RepID=A0A841H6T6_9BACT|nr:LytR C-terminal domain-containing protein [Longimicrobium terrae]MBB4639177.1 pyruvate/2-oxoglutarate dehydrogenase complex dihydrolipoamide acyltransferase (E2) component [Longimicrobium terrae]MBB6073419.1 pyruvate/2-oxoglutarate dehydrogenase complex dihydrolipoamide acyltransferase (E2) component [Longimicrobium terrae]NNC32593.1 LytR C-terminal domain-containing protein [Longimicrobium terrae]
MARSAPRSAAAKGGSGGGRIQVIGLFLLLLLVAVLVGSMVAGLMGGGGELARPVAAADSAAATADPVSATPAQGPRPGARVRVEVLNASGIPGLAAEGRRVLRDRGFDVVFIGNGAGFPPDSSLVLDRVGRMDAAREVADAIGIRRVQPKPDANMYVDATVVLGKDWRAAPESGEAQQ